MAEAAKGPPSGVGLVATDLDGTLLGSDHTLGPRDAAALRRLGRLGVVRVVATGRSRFSAERVLDRDFPVDYVAVSSGAGILRWRTGRLLKRHGGFEAADVERVARRLRGFGVDFMAHAPVPEDHRFRYVRARASNPDFDQRIGRYEEFASPWGRGGAGFEASQFVAILDPGEVDLFERVRAALAGCAVTRTTSPLDGRSLWVEVRPPGVGKAEALAWLAARYCLGAERTAAIGNDYNDSGMLRWSGNPFVVRNAAHELRERYPVVSSNDCGGFSDVVEAVRGSRGGGFVRPAAAAAEV